MTSTNTDRIEKQVVLRAPRSRVWRALTNHEQFGQWFGVTLDGPFLPGVHVRGKFHDAKWKDLTWNMVIAELEPERFFSFRWHPYAIEPKVDYSAEPMTTVSFTLDEVEGGTEVRLVEEGFDKVPLARRGKAFEMNDGGWTQQMKNIEKYVVE